MSPQAKITPANCRAFTFLGATWREERWESKISLKRARNPWPHFNVLILLALETY